MTGSHPAPTLLRPLALALLALPLVLAPAAPASGDKERLAKAEKRIDRFVGKMEKELKLSKDQSSQIKTILKRDLGESGPGMRAHCSGHEKGHGRKHGRLGHMAFAGHPEEVARQLRAESVDTAALNRAAEERLEAMRAHRAAAVAKFAEVHAVLTPGQRAKAAERMEKRAGKMKKECRH